MGRSAAALADDLARFFRGEPVSATRARVLYTAAKFVRRRRAASVLIVVCVIALCVGLTSLVVGIERAQRAEHETRAALERVTVELDRADSIASCLLEDVIDALNPSVTGKPVPRADDLLGLSGELARAILGLARDRGGSAPPSRGGSAVAPAA